jgi:hypothetical protein
MKLKGNQGKVVKTAIKVLSLILQGHAFCLVGFFSGIFILFIGANKCQKSRPTAVLPSALGGQASAGLNVVSHINAIS